MNKQPRLELPKYLDAVRRYVGQCVSCGTTEGLEVAHYSGLYADRLGKGMGCKCHDYAVARLCKSCHREMDTYASGNDDDRALAFVDAIYFTMRRLVLARNSFASPPQVLVGFDGLEKIVTDFMWLITSDDVSITAKYLIEFLASQREAWEGLLKQ